MKCRNCDNGTIIAEEEHGLVCSNCGNVAEPNSIQWDTDTSNLSFQNPHQPVGLNVQGLRSSSVYSFSETHKRFRKSSVTRQGLGYLREISDFLKIPKWMKEESESRYKEACEKHYLKATQPLKMALAGVAVYIVIRQNKMPLTMSYLSRVTRCPISLFGGLYKDVITNLKITLPTLRVEDYVESSCEKWNLTIEMKGYVVDMIPIFREFFMTECVIDNIMPCLAYIAYNTLLIRSNNKMSFHSFRSKNNIKCSRALSAQYKRMIALLTTLSKDLPWVTLADINEQNVFFYIDDIIKYQNTLVNDFVKSNGMITADFVRKTRGTKCNEEGASKKFKCDEEIEDTVHSHDLDAEELGEADIQDNDIFEYIRTAKEIGQLLCVRSGSQPDTSDEKDLNHSIKEESNNIAKIE